MTDGIYNRGVLDLAGNIGRLGRLAAPDGSATVQARLCGSTITVDLVVADGVVTDYAQEVRACALGQAAASVMARHIVGATTPELRALREAMRRMLKESGPAPTGRFAELAVLEPVRDYRPRHASTLLVFDAVVAALDAAVAKVDQAAEVER